MSKLVLASASNPMAVPLLIGLGLFVVLLAGLGGAMLYRNRSKLTRSAAWTPAQRAWRRRVLVSGLVGALLGVAAFIALGYHQLVLAGVLAVLGLGWHLANRRALKAPIND